MRKIGIMGGTFNPIHFGHLILAENAYEQAGLDQILFMPSNNPPHKNNITITDEHRTNMVKLAIKDNPHFALSTVEMKREGMTFTKDTLIELTEKNPELDYYFIVGADSFLEIQTWKDPQIIFDLCTILVAGRGNLQEEELNNQYEYLKHNFGAQALFLEMPLIEISSKHIRKKATLNQSIRYYVPENVMNYIADNNLYKEI
jgi:nicotinate-nucleotide adenylyltransferase